MAFPVLIVTPQAEFGESICAGMDAVMFDSFSTSDFTEAVRYARKNDCPVAILDVEREDVELSVMDIGFALRQVRPNLRFVLVAGAGLNADADSLSPAATLTKPLSMPDLNQLLETLLLSSPGKPKGSALKQMFISAETPVELSGPVWLKDVSKAAQHLTRLTLESSAQAALITLHKELWAYAGQLSREAAQELTDSLQHYWDAQGESDLLRFVRLRSTDAQHMLYARKLADNMLLALVFDAETPFSTIRSQANRLIKNLSETSSAIGVSTSSQKITPTVTGTVPSQPEASFEPPAPNLSSVLKPETEVFNTKDEVATPELAASNDKMAKLAAPANTDVYSDEDDDDGDDLPPISKLIGDVPPPIPPALVAAVYRPATVVPVEMRHNTGVNEAPTTPLASLNALRSEVDADIRPMPENQYSRESSPSIQRGLVTNPGQKEQPLPVVSNEQVEKLHPVADKPAMDETMASSANIARLMLPMQNRENLAETRVSKIRDDVQETRKQEVKDSPSVAETRPQSSGESSSEKSHRILLEPPSPSLVDLGYAFVLIPRFDTHHLVGDAAGRLNEWVPNLCLAFAWRLEYISVRPDYLQWIVRVPPNTSAGYVTRVIRQQTSNRLFAEFPRFRADNPSDDFWAPGSMIIGSTEPPPHYLVRDFIRRSRGMQGLGPNG